MTSAESGIDPYEKLLRVNSQGKHLNAYELLRLETFEEDQGVIEFNSERARKLLHSKFGEIDPSMWRQVYNEVEDAISTLTDLDKKQAYDKRLESETDGSLQLAKKTSNGAAAPVEKGDRIPCRKCSFQNPSSRRFCAQCGDALNIACPECGAMNTVHESFCGQCGVNLQDSAQAQRQALEGKFEEAEALWRDGRHDRAVEILRGLTKASHEGELDYAKRAAKSISEILLEKDQLLARAPQVEAEAKQLRDGKHAEKAVALIREIPKVLWHESLRELYEDVSKTRKQIKRIAQEIKLALKERRTSRLLPKVERLLELKPHDISAQRLADKLRKSQDQADRQKREKLVAKAKEYIRAHRYERAYEVLTEVPESVRTENFLSFFDQVSELAFLSVDLSRAVYPDPTLVGMASRLVKLMPKDKVAIDRLHKITQRVEQLKKHPESTKQTWNDPPKQTTLGIPVDHYPKFRKISGAEMEDNENYEYFSSNFIVASGLALQGLGLAKIKTNLLPSSGGMLGFLGGKKNPTAEAAWGIDLSNSGLKAILLRTDVEDEKEGKDKSEKSEKKKGADKPKKAPSVRIEQMIKVEYKRPLSRADDADRRGLIQDAIEQFFEIVGEDVFTPKTGTKPVVCLSLPATDVLGRFLELPPVDDKKIPKTVEYEVRHQIPFPLEELLWDFHVWDYPEKDEESIDEEDHKRGCVVVATRSAKLQERIAFLRGLGISPKIVQTDQLAVYNFFDFDLFSDVEYRQQMVETEQAIAVLDVGSDASHLIICAPNSVWFRSLEVGGENFTRILVRQMSLTFTKAEELKKKPDTAEEIFKFYDVIDSVLKNIAKETSYSINTFAGLEKERIAEVRLIGGGSYMHGLMTFLQYGKFLDV